MMHKIPVSCGVMFLSGVTLFPGTQLPLRIFEERYCLMLNEVLETSRMFAIAMTPPQETPKNPRPVVGLGMITTCVKQKDGTSNLMLAGIQRVRLLNAVRKTPFQAHVIELADSIDDVEEPVESVIQELIGICKTRIPKTEKPILEMLKALKNLDQLTDQMCALFIEPAEARHKLMQTLSLKNRIHALRILLQPKNRYFVIPILLPFALPILQ